MTVLKVKFGNDIRKTSVHGELTFNDLVLMILRIFNIKNESELSLKYKDSEGDLITLTDDSDLILALNEPSLTVEVSFGTSDQIIQDLNRHIASLQEGIQSLARSIASVELPARSSSHAPSQQAAPAHIPPSPVPSEKPEIPATIQPSLQEQADGHHTRELSAPLEEDIPLEAGAHDGFSQNFVPDPMQNLPPTSIPSFPQASVAPPPSQFDQRGPHTPHSSGNVPPQQFDAPPTHNVFNPHQPQQQPPSFAPPTSFAPPPSVGIPPQPQGQQQLGGFPPAPGNFGPPQGPPQNQQAPPQGQFPPQHLGQQFQGPPSEPAPPSLNNYNGPPSGFAPPQQHGVPPHGMPQQGPPSQGPPQVHHHQGVPPPHLGGPPMGGAPLSGPQGPQMGAPPMGGPPMGGPPMGGPPGGAPGAPGINPFARGQAFRQSPYHQ
ncbi:unnamed protein product [Auanema sp. JU1783]|nr:unnamed protein product [Auanema sp. JU1783]